MCCLSKNIGLKKCFLCLMEFSVHLSIAMVALGLTFTSSTAQVGLTNLYLITQNYDILFNKQKLRWDLTDSKGCLLFADISNAILGFGMAVLCFYF